MQNQLEELAPCSYQNPVHTHGLHASWLPFTHIMMTLCSAAEP